MKEVILRYINLPYSVRGYVQEDPNGDFNIYINGRLSYEVQQATIKHELSHIERGHFCNDVAEIQAIEMEAEPVRGRLA